MEDRKRGWKEKVGAELQAALPLKGRWLSYFFIGLSVSPIAFFLIVPRFIGQGSGPAGDTVTWWFNNHEYTLYLPHKGKPTLRME
jgi:hypothetical protein